MLLFAMMFVATNELTPSPVACRALIDVIDLQIAATTLSTEPKPDEQKQFEQELAELNLGLKGRFGSGGNSNKVFRIVDRWDKVQLVAFGNACMKLPK